MSNILAESGDILGGLHEKVPGGKSVFKRVHFIEAKAKKKRDDAAKKDAAALAAFRSGLATPESVKTIREDAAAAKKRKRTAFQGTGRQSTILSGVQTALKARLGE